MSWLALDAAIERNRKLLDLRARLRWSANDTLARVTRLLVTVREQAPSGDLSEWSAGQIASAMEPDGLAEPDAVLHALIGCGLLVEQDGHLLVKGWTERNGSYLRQASRERQRVAAGKARAATASRDEHGRYRSGEGQATDQRPTSDGASDQHPRTDTGRPTGAPAPASDGPARWSSDLPAPVFAGPAGPAQTVAGASTSQRPSSERPAQPAEQYRSSTGAGASDADSDSLRSSESLSRLGARPAQGAASEAREPDRASAPHRGSVPVEARRAELERIRSLFDHEGAARTATTTERAPAPDPASTSLPPSAHAPSTTLDGSTATDMGTEPSATARLAVQAVPALVAAPASAAEGRMSPDRSREPQPNTEAASGERDLLALLGRHGYVPTPGATFPTLAEHEAAQTKRKPAEQVGTRRAHCPSPHAPGGAS